MQDMANANFQMKFDHMFASIPMYDGSNQDTFDDWLYQVESLCEMSHRDIRIEFIGTATGKTAAEDTDPTHIIKFLGMMTNSEIARKITQKG